MPVAIDKPSKYFNTVIYTGDGASTKAITVGFQPDFVWIKDRTTAYDHHLFDAVRGGGNSLYSNDSVVENTYTTDITFDSNGFTTAGVGSAAIFYVNKSGDAFASWNWKANGSGSSNTSGSITSTVSANTTSGFSIVSWTASGATSTVGHGLGTTPSMIIFKDRSNVTNWFVYHKSVGATGALYLNATNATVTNAIFFNNTAPTSSVFTVSTYLSASPHIAYCFAEVKGYSKAFSYTGNGSTDGTFVYCGFRPAFVIIKRTDTTNHWGITDNKRNPYNLTNEILLANDSGTGYSGSAIGYDLLSNGFKIRNSDTIDNASGGTYIGFAIAEQPFVSSKGIVANAR